MGNEGEQRFGWHSGMWGLGEWQGSIGNERKTEGQETVWVRATGVGPAVVLAGVTRGRWVSGLVCSWTVCYVFINRRRLKLRRAQRAQRGSKIKLTRIHHQGELPSLHRQETRQQLTRRDSLFRAAVPGHTACLKQPQHASANIKKQYKFQRRTLSEMRFGTDKENVVGTKK